VKWLEGEEFDHTQSASLSWCWHPEFTLAPAYDLDRIMKI